MQCASFIHFSGQTGRRRQYVRCGCGQCCGYFECIRGAFCDDALYKLTLTYVLNPSVRLSARLCVTKLGNFRDQSGKTYIKWQLVTVLS